MQGSLRRLADISAQGLLFFLILFSPLVYGAVHPPILALLEVSSALIFLLVILIGLGEGRFRIFSKPLIVTGLLLILFVFFQFHSPFSASVFLPGTVCVWATKTEWLKLVSYFFIFISVANLMTSRSRINRLMFVVTATGFVMSIFYIMRYFGMPAPRGLINKDHYAGYLAMIVCLNVGLLLVPMGSDEREARRSPPHFLIFLTTLITASALFCTHSRGGMLSLLAAFTFMNVLSLTKDALRRKTWIFVLTAACVLLMLSWIGLEPILKRLFSVHVEVAGRYFGGRVPIWQAALAMIRDYPIFGSGFGTFSCLYEKYEVGWTSARYDHAHCDFLEFLCESGMVGILLIAAVGIFYASQVFRRIMERRDPFVLGMATGLSGALAALFFHSFTDFNLRIPSQAFLASIVLALLLNVLVLRGHSSGIPVYEVLDWSNLRKSRIARGLVGCILTAVIGFYVTTCTMPAFADRAYRRAVDASRLKLEKPRKVLSFLRKAVALDPLNAKYHFEIAGFYRSLGEPDNALREYRRAVELEETNAAYHQGLAWHYASLTGEAAQAELHFTKAIRMAGHNPYRYRSYALWLMKNGQRERAIEEFRRAGELYPSIRSSFPAGLDKSGGLGSNTLRSQAG